MCQFHPIHVFIRCHTVTVLKDYLVHLVRVFSCIFISVCTLEVLMGSLEVFSLDCSYIIVLSSLFVCFVAFVELHVMDEKPSMTLLLESESGFYHYKVLFNS